MPTVTLPPVQYDHYYNGPVIEKVMPLDEVRKYCDQIGNGPNADACSGIVRQNGACFIVLPSDGFDSIDAYRRHELAHFNGWPANHMSE
jgi:hypothetical protein